MNTVCKLLPFAIAASAFADNTFFLNEAGYDLGMPFSAVVQSTEELEGTKWSLYFNRDNMPQTQGLPAQVLAEGVFGKGENPDNWSKSGKYYRIEIPYSFMYAGTYYIGDVTGSPSTSAEFSVGGNQLAKSTLGMVLDYFYNDRADKAPITEWDQKVSVYGSSGVTRDVRGGWYDASGDVSKYLSHLSYANYLNPQQIPLTVWALAFVAERIPELLASTSTKAKTADEAAYGADFLVRMLDEQGFFYMTVFDNWGMGSRYLCAFSGSDGVKSNNYQTAFREGGGMAIAGLARVAKLGVKGDYTSEQYLAAAEKAYAHLSEKQSIGSNCAYCDDGKENIIDDYTALLAATELFLATGKASYMDDMESRAGHLAARISEDGYFWSDDAKTRPFWHASDAGLPLIALMRFLEAEMQIAREPCPPEFDCSATNGEIIYKTALSAVRKHLSWLISITNKVENPFGYARQTYKTGGNIKDGFFIPHDNESKYWWQGEDARIASLAAAASLVASDLSLLDTNINKYATDQLDWILGKNPYGTCMMYGIGKKNPAKYDGTSDYDATLKGGIANGITGKSTDGSGIAWDDDGVAYVGFDPKEPWNNWRWVEQWLPHSTWYLMALATRYDENPIKLYNPDAIKPKTIASAKFSVLTQGRTLTINARGTAKVHVLGINGAEIATAKLTAGHATLNLDNVQSGIYMVKVDGFGAKKIVIK